MRFGSCGALIVYYAPLAQTCVLVKILCYTSAMTIDDVKRIQRDNDLLDKHVVWIGPTGFAIAHTDHERATLHPLTDCALHNWLNWQPDQPAPTGVYIAEDDDGWKFSGLTV